MTDEQLKSAAAQAYLAELGFYFFNIDGQWGSLSQIAARQWLAKKGIQIMARVIPGHRAQINGTPSNETLRTLAAQMGLAALQYYLGPVDGRWGPQSTAAARAWNNPGQVIKFQTPYDVARHYLGTAEIPGKSNNPVIMNWYRRLLINFVADDETPWCSTLINFCASETGYERSGKLNARSWLAVGEPIRLKDAREGDVVIFRRGSNGWEGHVAFFIATNHSHTYITHLGGNQGDKVSIANSDADKLLGIRRLRTLDQLQGPTNKI